jgi:hypothetical protein
MPLTTAQSLAIALCEVFGMDPNTVKSLSLTLGANKVAVLSVERFVTVTEDGRAARLKAETGHYYLCDAEPIIPIAEEGRL